MMSRTGFTILEILMVVTMITIIAGAGFLVISNVVGSDIRENAAQLTAQAMRRAQRSSRVMRLDDPWGAFVASTSVTVFRGDSFGGRDIQYDEIFVFSRAVQLGGVTEVIFNKGTGLPAQPATISLTFESETQHVIVSESGGIYYGP